MAINFPDSPLVGAIFTGTNGVVYTYDGTRWRVSSSVSNLIPIASSTYDLGTNAVRWRSLYIDTINVLSTAASTSSSTGALLVAGGVGIQGALHVRGQIYTQGFLLGPGSEFDPIYSSGTAATITATNISNWNTAYSWGNHAVRGYITTASFSSVTNHLVPLIDSGIDLGSPTKKWRSLYVSTNTIFIGTTSLTILNGQFSLNGVIQVATTSSLRQGTDSITLNNNRLSIPGKINFGVSGVSAPNTTTYVGEKLVLWDNGGGFAGERHFAIGIENGHMWFSSDTYNDPGNGFKWYAAEHELMKLDSSGTLQVSKVRVPFTYASDFSITTTKDYGFAQLEHTFKVDGNKIVLPTGAGFIDSGGDIWSLDGLTNKLIFPNNSFIEYGVGTNISTGSLSLYVLPDTSTVVPPNFSISVPKANFTSSNTWTFASNGLIFPNGTTSTGNSVELPYQSDFNIHLTKMMGTYTVSIVQDGIRSGNQFASLRTNVGEGITVYSDDKYIAIGNASSIDFFKLYYGAETPEGNLPDVEIWTQPMGVGTGSSVWITANGTSSWRFRYDGSVVFPDGTLQTTAAQNPSIFLASTGTFTNKTIKIGVGQGNVFQIQGNTITSYTGSGPIVALSGMPTLDAFNIGNGSNLTVDGGTGLYYWNGPSGVAGAGINKAGVYRSNLTATNSLFSFGANGSGTMSAAIEGSLFVGTVLPSNNGGLNTDYSGWIVSASGYKAGGDIDTLGKIYLNGNNVVNDSAVIDFFSGTGTNNHIITLDSNWTMKVKARAQGSNQGSLWLEAGQNTKIKIKGNQSLIELAASTGTNTSTWIFDHYGNLSIPGNINVATSIFAMLQENGVGLISGPINVDIGDQIGASFLRVNLGAVSNNYSGFQGDVELQTYINTSTPSSLYIAPQEGAYRWRFSGSDGVLEFPDQTAQNTAYPGNLFPNLFTITNTVNATSTVTGALQVAGGAGIGGNLVLGKNLQIGGVFTSTNNTQSTSTQTGALVISGGVGVGGNLYVGGEIVVNRLTVQFTTITTTLVQTDDVVQTYNTTNATSTTSGALQISGGAGIGRDVWIGGSTRIVGALQTTRGTHEVFTTSSTATSTVNYDCSTTQIFYHVTTGTQANWTANFTNLSLSSGFATSVSIVINQGTPPYYPSAVQIAGAAQTLNWQGNNTPTMNAFRTDVVTFSIINNNGTYLVLGSSTGF